MGIWSDMNGVLKAAAKLCDEREAEDEKRMLKMAAAIKAVNAAQNQNVSNGATQKGDRTGLFGDLVGIDGSLEVTAQTNGASKEQSVSKDEFLSN